MTTEQYSIGYEEGYQAGWNAAMDAKPAQQEPVAEITAEDMGRPFNAICIRTHFYKEIPHVGTKLYTSPQPAQPSKPLPFNKGDMEGLDVNQRLGFKLGWKSAEEAHGIKENT